MDKLTREERETLVNFCEADGYYRIETSVQKHMNRFDKLGYECTRVDTYPDGSIMCKEYKVPERAISYRSPIAPSKRELTEAQKERLKEMSRKATANRAKIKETGRG